MGNDQTIKDFIAEQVLALSAFMEDRVVKSCDDESIPTEQAPEKWWEEYVKFVNS